MLDNEENGLCLEYIYDNYFQCLEPIYDIVNAEKNVKNSVLQELVEKVDEVNALILCKIINLASKHWIGICILVVDVR